jgi:hypothetical protein
MLYEPITYKMLCDAWIYGEDGKCQRTFKIYIGTDKEVLTKELGLTHADEFDWHWISKNFLNDTDFEKYHLSKTIDCNSKENAEIFFSLYIIEKQSKVDKIVEQAFK